MRNPVGVISFDFGSVGSRHLHMAPLAMQGKDLKVGGGGGVEMKYL